MDQKSLSFLQERIARWFNEKPLTINDVLLIKELINEHKKLILDNAELRSIIIKQAVNRSI